MILPDSLNLHVEGRLSEADAKRQARSAQVILERFRTQPGVILGDEVGMGKTFVALAVAAAFVPTQLPLGILEGFLCMGALRFISVRRPEFLQFARTFAQKGETA